MTHDPAQAVLRDFENILWLALLLGLALSSARRFFFQRPAPAAAGGVLEPEPALPAFIWADLVLMPLVLIKYSFTLQQFMGAVVARLTQFVESAGPAAAAPPSARTGPAETAGMSTEGILLDALLGIMLLCLVIVAIQWVGRRDPVKLFGLNRLPAWKLALWVSAGALIATPTVMWLSSGLPEVLKPYFGSEVEEQAAVKNIRHAPTLAFQLALIVNAILIAPVVEETVFRGFFYGTLKRYTGALFAAFITAGLFAAAHQNLLSLLPLWGLALFFTLFYEASRCLWVPIAMHAVFNAVNVILILRGFGGDMGD